MTKEDYTGEDIGKEKKRMWKRSFRRILDEKRDCLFNK